MERKPSSYESYWYVNVDLSFYDFFGNELAVEQPSMSPCLAFDFALQKEMANSDL